MIHTETAFTKTLGEQQGDEGLRDVTPLELQQERQAILEHAATYHDDPELIEDLFDSINGGSFHHAFVALCRDVLEANDGDSVVVRPDFRESVEVIAIERFKRTLNE